MALKLNADAQLVFFSKVFGPNHSVVGKAKALGRRDSRSRCPCMRCDRSRETRRIRTLTLTAGLDGIDEPGTWHARAEPQSD